MRQAGDPPVTDEEIACDGAEAFLSVGPVKADRTFSH